MELKFKQFEIKSIQAPNFLMSPMELKDYIDFEVKRIYFITNLKGETGAHCHYKEIELFVLISGACTAVVDKGDGLEEIKMEATKTAFYVGAYVWHHFKDFSEDAVLLALSSTNYSSDRSDYIEDYEKYKELTSLFCLKR